MYIVIVGAGEVGSSIAESLADSHDIAVVDIDGSRVESLMYDTDILGIEGDGTDLDTLKEADVEDADILIASTDDDQTNIVTCSTTATVTVVDNGSGLPSEEQRVIEAGTEDPLEHGSGLGLWFAYWLITYVGGTIDITADHDGTEIRVTVPTRE